MPDNVTVDNGGLTDYTVSADEAASGQVQRIKLAYSADGVDTHVQADADGLLVNLGANNDVELSAASLAALENITVTTDLADELGAVTETAPATDTASSGLNGRLQRVAQRLTSLIALLPSSIGQKNKAGSLSVTLASDQDTVPVSGTFYQATQPVSGTVTANLSATDNAVLDDISAKLPSVLATDRLKVDGSGVTQPVSGTVTVTGVATETTLSAASAKLPATLGQKAMTASMAVVVASDQSAVPVSGTFYQATQPVSGTVAATQSGTWTVQPGNTANTTAWKVDGSAVTQPVSVASVPSHAVTNAGVFAVQVDGNALTSLQLIDDTVATLGTTTYSEATTKGQIIGAVRRDADTTLVDTTNEVGPLQMDANGRLKVEAFSGETLPVSNSVLSVVGTGTEATAQRVTIATDSTGVLSVDDNGGALTVDGTVAATQSGTWTVQPGNTANTTAWKVDGSAVTQPVSIATAPVLVAGSAIIGKVGIDQTTPGTTNAVSAVLTTGSAGIGKLTANSGVDIGDVDITSVIPGTGATNAGKAIDSAAGATDTGVAPLAIRDDALSTLTPVEGDWAPLRVNSTGALHVTGGGGGTEYNIDTASGGTDTGKVTLAIRDDALSTLTPIEGDYVPLRTDSTGALWVNAGTGAAQYNEDAAHSSGDAGNFVLSVRQDTPASTAGTTGDYAAISTDASGNLRVVSSAATGTQTSVNDSASNVTLLASNAARKGASFYNDSTQVLYIRLQATATTANFSVKVQPDGLYELPGPTIYTGIVDGIWAADASGACRVTELT